MATKKASEFRGYSSEELNTKLSEAKEELFNLRFQAATGQLESHGRLKAVRGEIARIYMSCARESLELLQLKRVWHE